VDAFGVAGRITGAVSAAGPGIYTDPPPVEVAGNQFHGGHFGLEVVRIHFGVLEELNRPCLKHKGGAENENAYARYDEKLD
jgi:hypothetical protein